MHNNSVVVIAGITHREGFIDEYEAYLAKEGIEFHLEPLPPLPGGANSINARMRINHFRRMAEKFIDYKALYLTDAWDVLCFASKDELIAKAPETFICSAERNCYPEANLATVITGDTPWKYANNGCCAGNPSYLLEWCEKALKTDDLDSILDQAWFNRRLAEGSDLVPLDSTTNIFYVVSAWLEDGALQVKDGRPWNAFCNTKPAFLHFSGKCPDDWVRKMLQEERKTR